MIATMEFDELIGVSAIFREKDVGMILRKMEFIDFLLASDRLRVLLI